MRRLAPALVLVALLGACGGGTPRLTHDEYQQKVSRELRALGSAIVAAGVSAAGAEKIAGDLDAAAGRLEELDPPQDAEAANADLASALRSYALDLRDFAVEVRGAPRARREAQTRLARSAAVRAIQRAQAELARAGYAVTP